MDREAIHLKRKAEAEERLAKQQQEEIAQIMGVSIDKVCDIMEANL